LFAAKIKNQRLQTPSNKKKQLNQQQKTAIQQI